MPYYHVAQPLSQLLFGILAKTKILLYLIILSSLLQCSSPSTPIVPPPQGKISKIVYGGDKSYFPFESLDKKGQPTGFNVELIRAIGEVLGAEVEIQLLPWTEVKRKVRNNELDIACFFYTPERDRYADYAFYHNVIYHNLVTRTKELQDLTLDSLDEMNIIVQQESWAAEYLLREHPNSNIIFTTTELEALELLNSGEYDCAIVSQYHVHHFIKDLNYENIIPRGSPLMPSEYAFVVPEGRNELLSQINQAVTYLRATGKYSKLYLKYFGLTEQEVLQRVLRVTLWIAIPLLGGLGLSLVWSRSLQYQVKKKTQQIQEELRERKIAEEKLRESEAFLKEAQRLAALGSWTYDFATGRMEWSEEQYRIMGVPLHERPYKVSELLEMVHPEDYSKMQRMMERAPDDPDIFNVDYRIYLKDGEMKYLFLTSHPRYDQQGKIVGMYGTVMDITQRKESEAELQKQNQALEQANEELDNFVYSASHDMRAPLASTLGLIQIMRDEPPNVWSQDYLGLIEKSTLRLDQFTKEVIDYSANRKLSVTTEQVNMSELIAESFDQHQYLNPQLSIRLINNTHQNGIISSDARRLRVILNNLISNAIKYHNPSRENRYVKVEVIHKEQQILILVEDNGQGIAPEYLENIFDMFIQATHQAQGSGLGLYIVRESVRKLNGQIDVQSEFGEGTMFTITLPHS